MPKLSPDTQRARRERILDAAAVCFARSGFHGCTMQDICKEAGISAGALYLYFDSKEDLIAGIAERDRREFQERFAQLLEAPDFLTALSGLGEQYLVEEPAERRLMCVEIGVEATRNATVSKIFHGVDAFVLESFSNLFQQLHAQGRIKPQEDTETLTKLFALICDGLMWRRATDPDFDAAALIPAVTRLIETMINPTLPDGDQESVKTSKRSKVQA